GSPSSVTCTSAKTPPRPTHPDRGEKPTQPNRLGGFALGTGSRTGRRQVCRHESYHTITPSMRLVGKQPCRIRSNFVGLGDSRSPPISDAARYDSSKTPQPPPNESTFRKLYGSSPKPPAVATAPPTSSTSSAAAGD